MVRACIVLLWRMYCATVAHVALTLTLVLIVSLFVFLTRIEGCHFDNVKPLAKALPHFASLELLNLSCTHFVCAGFRHVCVRMLVIIVCSVCLSCFVGHDLNRRFSIQSGSLLGRWGCLHNVAELP